MDLSESDTHDTPPDRRLTGDEQTSAIREMLTEDTIPQTAAEDSQPDMPISQEIPDGVFEEGNNNLTQAPRLTQAVRMSSRIRNHGRTYKYLGTTSSQAQATDMAGTHLTSHNSFAALDDDDILFRALEIGIDITALPIAHVHALKDLEIVRHNIELKDKQQSVEEGAVVGDGTTILLDWKKDHIEEGEFTPVVSKKQRKKIKSAQMK